MTAALARSYLNLGILQAQGERFEAAAELFEKAAAVDPEFPQVQSSLGVAYFNARRFDERDGAADARPGARSGNPGLTRMLALAWLEHQRVRQGRGAAAGRPGAGDRPITAVRVRPRRW